MTNIHTKTGVTPKSVLGWLGLLLFAGVLAVFVFSGVVKVTIVNGESMLPTYKSGDLIVSVKQNEYKVGDVIVYHPQSLECNRCNVIHRIIDGDPTKGWVTQGDNNPNVDVWMPKSDEIVGSVQAVVPLGNISFLLFSPAVWFFVLSVLLLAYVIVSTKDYYNKHKNQSPTPTEELQAQE